MPPGRTHRPLFDLMQGGTSVPRVSSSAPSKPTVRVELKPRTEASSAPQPEPVRTQPGPPVRTDGVRSGPLASLLGDATVRVPLNALYFGAAAAIALGVLILVSGVKWGRAQAEGEFERFKLSDGGVAKEPLTQAPPLAGKNAPPAPVSPPTAGASPTAAGEKSASRSGKPPDRPSAPPGTSPNGQPYSGPPILTSKGLLYGDPRQSGLNYLHLATLQRADAEAAILFLDANGQEAVGVPMDGGSGSANNPNLTGKYVVVAMPGISGEQWSKKMTARSNLEGQTARLGQVWQRDHKGPSNFAKPEWRLFKGQ